MLEFRYRSRRLLICRLNEVRSVLETAVVLKATTCRGGRTEEGELVSSSLDVLPVSEEAKRQYHRTYAHTVWMERERADRKGLWRYWLELADWRGRVWTSKALATLSIHIFAYSQTVDRRCCVAILQGCHYSKKSDGGGKYGHKQTYYFIDSTNH